MKTQAKHSGARSPRGNAPAADTAKPDLVIAPLSGANTQISILDGKDGSKLLKQLVQPGADVQQPVPGNPGPTFGQGLAAPGDLNGDGEPDFVVGAPYQDAGGNQDQGRLYFFVSDCPPGCPPVVTPPVVTPPRRP